MRLRAVPLRSLAAVVLSVPLLGHAVASTIENGVAQNPAVAAIKITTPSTNQNQNQVAPGRDFNVIGEINTTAPLPASSSISVVLSKLQPDGSYRQVQNVFTTDKSRPEYLNVNYPDLEVAPPTTREQFRASGMPDLVYDPNNAGSFRNAWRKVYFTDKYFTAQFVGGRDSRYVDLRDVTGAPIPELDSGYYQIEARLFIGTEIITATHDFTVGVYPERVLARFTPQTHFNRVSADAATKNPPYDLYLDPFPGYWETRFIPALGLNVDMRGEIKPRWRFADALEYVGNATQNAITHPYLYNITENSAANNVEVGVLQKTQAIGDYNKVIARYYDIGEPKLTYQPSPREGVLRDLPAGATLLLTRADFTSGSESQDNQIDINALPTTPYQLDTSSITTRPNTKIAINGVLRPIQNVPGDIVTNPDSTYTIKNKISSIQYKVKNTSGTVVYQTTKPTNGMTRLNIEPGAQPQTSIYEFKHVFDTSGWSKGSYVVEGVPYDSHQVPVGPVNQPFKFGINVS